MIAGVVSTGDWDCLERTTYTRATLAADFLDAERRSAQADDGCSYVARHESNGFAAFVIGLALMRIGRRRWKT